MSTLKERTDETGIGTVVTELINRLMNTDWVTEVRRAHDQMVSFLVTIKDTRNRTKTIPVRIVNPTEAEEVRRTFKKRKSKPVIILNRLNTKIKHLLSSLLSHLGKYRRPKRKPQDFRFKHVLVD